MKKHQKDIRINGRLARVWVLRETDERILYIPIKAQHRTDYTRFNKLAASTPHGSDLLNHMGKTKLDNGRNALALYDNVIQIANKHSESEAVRIPRPDEPERAGQLQPTPAPQPVIDNSAKLLEEKAEEHMKVERSTTDPRTLAAAGIEAVYELPTADGKVRQWTAKANGPYPKDLQVQIDNGKDPSEFRIK